MPCTILFAAMATFGRLTRSHELVVTRAAGVSVWQFLLPVLGSSVVIGMLAVSALNPLASALLSRYESLEASYMRNQESKLAVSESGLWLSQADDGGQRSEEHTSELQSLMRISYAVFCLNKTQTNN